MNSVASGDTRIAFANAILTGWNVGLIAAFLTVIVLVVLFGGGGGLQNRTAIALVLLAGLLDGVVLGYLVARRVVAWFARRQPWTARAWLAVLIAVTLMSFPGLFRFSI
jgi:hypothetical protein